MHRAGWIAAAIVGWTVCGATRSSAQAPPPEGWVVLSVDEYRARVEQVRRASIRQAEIRAGIMADDCDPHGIARPLMVVPS